MVREHPVRAGEQHGEYPGLEFAQEIVVSSQERWWLRRPWSRDDGTERDREGRVICVRPDAGKASYCNFKIEFLQERSQQDPLGEDGVRD